MRLKIVFLVFLLVVLNASVLIAEEVGSLEGYVQDSESIDKFIGLEGKGRNEVWNSGEAIDRAVLVDQIIEERVNKKQASFETSRDLFKSSMYHYLENGGTIPEVYGVQVDIDSYDGLKKFAKDNFGMDLDSQVSNIKDTKGLSSEDLSWSEEGENIIGKTGLWLDLDNPPFGTESIEYDGENFVLGMKNGGKIVVTPGSMNEKGELAFLSKGSDARSVEAFVKMFEDGSKTPVIDALKAVGKDLTTPNIREIVTKDFLTPNFGLGNLEVLDEGGEVTLNSEGFNIDSADTTVKYGEMTFGSGVGDGAEGGIGEGEDGSGLGVEDAGAGIGEGEDGAGMSAEGGEVGKKSSVKFQGDRIVLENIDFQRNGYVKVKAQDEMIVKFGDADLPKGKNVVNMNGENVVVQGEGEVELLRNINSLAGVDCGEGGFVVRAGDMEVEFKGDEMKVPRLSAKKAFLIDDIRLVNDGELVGKPYKMTYEGERDEFVLRDNDRTVVGRNTLQGLYGISVDMSVALGVEGWGEIGERMEGLEVGSDREEAFVSAMMDSDFAFRIDTHVPISGVQVAGDKIIDLKNKYVSPRLAILWGASYLPSSMVQPKTVKSVGDIISNSIEGLKGRKLNPSEPAILLQNHPVSESNPEGNPSIDLLFEDGTRESVPLTGNDAKLVRDSLEGVVRFRTLAEQTLDSGVIKQKMEVDRLQAELDKLEMRDVSQLSEVDIKRKSELSGRVLVEGAKILGRVSENKLPVGYKKSLWYQNIGQSTIFDVAAAQLMKKSFTTPFIEEFKRDHLNIDDVVVKTSVTLGSGEDKSVEVTENVKPKTAESASKMVLGFLGLGGEKDVSKEESSQSTISIDSDLTNSQALSTNVGVTSDNDISTWISDLNSLRGLDFGDKNSDWNNADLELRKEIVNKIANSFRANSEIKLIGFENGLKWGDGLVIGNGNAWIDLEKIHLGIIEIEYLENDDGKYFVFRLKDGREILVGKGSLDEKGNYINEDLMSGVGERDRSVNFKLEGGELKVGVDGKFIFGGGAKVIIDGREFVSGLEGGGSVKIVESGYFRVKGLKVFSGDAIVSVGDELTDVIFKEGDYSSLENYVQIYEGELKSFRADPLNSLASITEGRILNVKGKDIEVEIISDVHEGVINGENIVVKNGEIVQRFDGAKTFINRKGFEAFVVSDLVNLRADGGGEIVTEVVGGEEEGGIGEGDDGEGVSVSVAEINNWKVVVKDKSGTERFCTGECKKTSFKMETAKVEGFLNPDQLAEIPPGKTEKEFYDVLASEGFDRGYRISILMEKVSRGSLLVGGLESEAGGGPVTKELIARDIKAEAQKGLNQGLMTKGEKVIFDSMVNDIVNTAGFPYYPKGSNVKIDFKYGKIPTARVTSKKVVLGTSWGFQTYDTTGEFETKTTEITDPQQQKVLSQFLSEAPKQDGIDGQSPPEEWRNAYKEYQKLTK